MAANPDSMGRTSIQVTEELADELWSRKQRGESYEDVLWRLIDEADDEQDEQPEPPEPASTDTESERETEDAEDELEFPSGRDREECHQAIEAATDYVRENGSASMREIVTDVMPEHDLGYSVPELEEGERYRGSWWRKIVKPGLEKDGRLDAPSGGRREWRWVGSR